MLVITVAMLVVGVVVMVFQGSFTNIGKCGLTGLKACHRASVVDGTQGFVVIHYFCLKLE